MLVSWQFPHIAKITGAHGWLAVDQLTHFYPWNSLDPRASTVVITYPHNQNIYLKGNYILCLVCSCRAILLAYRTHGRWYLWGRSVLFYLTMQYTGGLHSKNQNPLNYRIRPRRIKANFGSQASPWTGQRSSLKGAYQSEKLAPKRIQRISYATYPTKWNSPELVRLGHDKPNGNETAVSSCHITWTTHLKAGE